MSSFRAVVVAFAVAVCFAGALGSADAQYLPPQPAPPPYAASPVYRDADGAPIDPRYVQPAPAEGTPGQVASQPYFAPQPLSGVDERPPAEVSGADASDITGSVKNPPASAPAPGPAAQSAPPPAVVASLPQAQPDQDSPSQLPPRFRRQVVNFPTTEPAGTIIIDTPNTYLYLVLGHGQALRYGIGVGRDGFTWSGS
ncbi:MAG TPA: hypothetical protein VHY10_15425, partial [Xanthobacteraceae bacterium]|nr:hypothetical protein [Xanthobacteraceae bacterium]